MDFADGVPAKNQKGRPVDKPDDRNLVGINKAYIDGVAADLIKQDPLNWVYKGNRSWLNEVMRPPGPGAVERYLACFRTYNYA